MGTTTNYEINGKTTTLNETQPRWITKEIIIQNKNKLAENGLQD